MPMRVASPVLVVALAVLAASVWRMWPRAQPPASVAAATGCVACHAEPVPPHGEATCEQCHLGDPDATTVPLAHDGLEAEPGALETSERTCGLCHPLEHHRVVRSTMATGRGMVAVDRFAFGEQDSLDGTRTLSDVLDEPAPSPAEDHLRRLCAGCHLHTRRDNRDDAVQGTGSGCGACHVTPSGEGHPDIEGVPDDRACLGCHSRSSRISLSYAGLAEISGAAECEQETTLYDGRRGCVLEPDVHHRAGLGCVDCHLHTELMGDGEAHVHKEEALELHCETCHGPNAPRTTWAKVNDPITETVLRLRGQTRAPDEPVRLGARGTPVWNLRPAGPGWTLEPKRGGAPRAVPPAPAGHAGDGHERLSCVACHTSWAPRCTSCHTRYDPAGEQWDFGTATVKPGAWVERSEAMSTGPPSLGVTAEGRIVPAVPGMIAELERPGGTTLQLRRFAPATPHTTGPAARSCVSCHTDPVAVGLGEGDLVIASDGPRFTPSDPDPRDPRRARDAWVRLDQVEPGAGTRRGFRSLDRAERDRVMLVGRCLGCHGGRTAVFDDFDAALADWRAGRCADPPRWPFRGR